MTEQKLRMRFFLSVVLTTLMFASTALANKKTAGSVASQSKETGSSKPNIIVVLVDDLGWSDLTCQGSKYYETPHIDQLASQGIRFTQGYASCAVCSPTRAALMTGRNPARVGITDWIRAKFQRNNANVKIDTRPPFSPAGRNAKLLLPKVPYWMELEEITIAELLAKAGYKTCYIGKWHLGVEGYFPEQQGFHENHGGCDLGQPPSYFDPYKNKNYDIPNLPARKKGEYLTDREGDEAVAFIRANKDRPFYLQLSHYAVHTPIQAKPELTKKYQAKPKNGQRSGKTNSKYAAMIESVDDATGRLLKTLDELNLRENTLIIFTSDNGGLGGVTNNAPLRAGKGTCYEGGVRVPWIISWPNQFKSGVTNENMIISHDVLPTLCAAAGIQPPTDRVIDGVNLLPLLQEKTTSLKRDTLFWHYPHYHRSKPYSIIRQGDYKLIRHYESDTLELFNLAADLSETKNLAAENPKLTAELNAKLTKLLTESGALLPKKNPKYDPNLKPKKKK